MKTQLIIASCAAAIFGLVTFSGTALAQQKTAKACEDEWTASKTALQASGKKKKDFIAECRGGTSAAAPAATPAPPPTAAPAKPTPPAKPTTAATPTAADEFATEALAKAHCPTDTVVWVNLASKIYHYPDHKDYGKTKKGAYMCEKDTTAAGFRASKTEKKT
jgi:hypothetical protein